MFTLTVRCLLLLFCAIRLLVPLVSAGAQSHSHLTLEPAPNPPVRGVTVYWLPWTTIQPRGYPVLNQSWAIRPFLGDTRSSWLISRVPDAGEYSRTAFVMGRPAYEVQGSVPSLVSPQGGHPDFPMYLDNEGKGIGAGMSDILIDRDRILLLGEKGELSVAGLWRPEYLKLLVCGLEGPEHIHREFLKDKKRDMMFVDGVPRQALDVRKLRSSVEDVAQFPWGEVGCLRLGNRFFAWRSISDSMYLIDLDPSDGPDAAGTRFLDLKRVFGLGFGSFGDPAADGKEVGWAFMTTDRGIVCRSRNDDTVTLTSLDGKQDMLAELPGDLERLYNRDGKVAVLKVTHKGRLRLVSFDSKGTLSSQTKWYPTNRTTLRHMGIGSLPIVFPYWTMEVMETVGDKEVCVLEGYELDEATGQIVLSFSLSIPKSHYIHSALATSPSMYRHGSYACSPFEREGRRMLYIATPTGESFFDMVTGELVDPAPFQRQITNWKQPAADLREISFDARGCMPLYHKYDEGSDNNDRALRPSFDLLDTGSLLRRYAHLGTVKEWADFNGCESTQVVAWYPIRRTAFGVWFACYAIATDNQLGHHVTFVSLESLAKRP